MSARKLFVQDPLAFLKDNILRCQFFDGHVNISESRPLVVTVKVVKNDPKIVNRPGKVYYLTTDVAGCDRTEKVPIFWLGYKDDSVVRSVLTNNSRLMFTANMDGCTLGVGSQNGKGVCLVSHANNKSVGAMNQALAQQQQLRGVYGQDDFWAVQPSAYMDAMGGSHMFKGTNFGINRDGWWFFYTHSWMLLSYGSAGNYVHGGTEEASFLG